MVDQQGNMELASTFALNELTMAFEFSTSRMSYYYSYYHSNLVQAIDFTVDWKHYIHALDLHANTAEVKV